MNLDVGSIDPHFVLHMLHTSAHCGGCVAYKHPIS